MGVLADGLKAVFHQAAAVELPDTDFARYLAGLFDRATAKQVLDAFKQINLPPPQDQNEFLSGTEGAIIFLNKYGLVIRIEGKNTQYSSGMSFDRIDNSPWILKPLASIHARKVVIEICPGCHLGSGLIN